MYIASCLPAIRAAVQKGAELPNPKRPRSSVDLPTELQAAVLRYIRSKLKTLEVDEKDDSVVFDGFLRLYADLTVLAFRLPDDSRELGSGDDSPHLDLVKLLDLYLADVFVCRVRARSVLAGVELVHQLFPYASISQQSPDTDLTRWCEIHYVPQNVRILLHGVLGDAPAIVSRMNVAEDPTVKSLVAHSPSQAKVVGAKNRGRGPIGNNVQNVPKQMTSGDISALNQAIVDHLGKRGCKMKRVFRTMLESIYQVVVHHAEKTGFVVLGREVVDSGSAPHLISARIDLMMGKLLKLPDLLSYPEQVEIVKMLIVNTDMSEFEKMLEAFSETFDKPAHALLQMVRDLPGQPLVWLAQQQGMTEISSRKPAVVETPVAGSIAQPAVIKTTVGSDGSVDKELGTGVTKLPEPIAVDCDEAELAEIMASANRSILPSETHYADALTAYLAAIRRLRVLSHEEMCDRTRKFQALLEVEAAKYRERLPPEDRGKTLSLDEVRDIMTPQMRRIFNFLWEHNLWVVLGVARRYKYTKMPFPDLIQEGNIGLATAIIRFDPNRGSKFSTYAAWWVRHAVSRANADYGRTVALPDNLLSAISRYRQQLAALTAQSAEPPDNEQLLSLLAYSPRILARVQSMAAPELSIDAPRNAEDERTLGDFLEGDTPPIDSVLADRQLATILHQVLREMPRIQRDILIRSYGIDCEPQSLADIGRELVFSRERIRQIQKIALRNLSSRMKKLVGDDVGVAA